MNLEVLLKALKRGRRIEILPVQPVKLLVDVLLGEDEHVELFAFDEVGALGHLLDEHAQQVAPLLQKLVTVAPKALFFGQCRDVKPGQTLDEAVAKG